jgi:hypothetical protein
MLTKLTQNDSSLPCQNALKLTYTTMCTFKKFCGVIPPDPAYRGGEVRAGRKGGSERVGQAEEGNVLAIVVVGYAKN